MKTNEDKNKKKQHQQKSNKKTKHMSDNHTITWKINKSQTEYGKNKKKDWTRIMEQHMRINQNPITKRESTESNNKHSTLTQIKQKHKTKR